MVEIVLPWPPSVNHYWRTWQGRPRISHEGRQYREAVADLVRKSGHGKLPDAPLAVHIEAWMPDRRKRDLDNALKAPLDALTHAGLWDDDSQIHDLRITRAPVVKGGALKIRVEDRTC
ncbi:RusA family crossover junction endodeoxyribonuclease [Brachymonas sp. J145]|uniref:RusA family crossover junction endodeoxyribonuclease n=1 Tax=Brachymonas sp. J145 TaxID=3116489 RepID=UPI002E79F659|nr:RusA family crossover junction endodeoxyribonuclease [Brachymonas sp. J145]MEE1653752.1 RusA family crossover junction endodeoxyribonuclease [Brachymonas sp. J145]